MVGPLAPGTEIGGYRIEGPLGEGGMGTVYEARQLSLNRTVALKLLSPALGEDPAFRERFRREGLLQASLDHPHIVTVYEAGEANGTLFLSMRLIRGPTLRQLIRGGELDAARSLRLLGPVADALDTAHAAGLIHRDIKPQNVLVGPNDHAYLADFGLGKVPDEASITETGALMGTVNYISPEQLRGERATARSDVYAFACVLYETLTGTVPFPRETSAAVVFAHMSDPPPRASAQRPDLPSALDEVLLRGMAKEPGERPASAGELMREVEHSLDHASPVAMSTRVARPAAPARVLPRLGRPVLVGLLVATVAAVAVVALALGGGGRDGEEQAGEESGEPSEDVAPRLPATLGSGLSTAGDPIDCSGDPEPTACTVLQTALPGRSLSVPSNGVVVRWRVRNAAGTLTLLVMRGSEPGQVVGSSKPAKVSGSGRKTFEARVPIAKGERVALEVAEDARFATSFVDGADLNRWSPPLGVGGAPAQPSYTDPDNAEILFNADVEPDRDRDGFGDRSQDACPRRSGRKRGCPRATRRPSGRRGRRAPRRRR